MRKINPEGKDVQPAIENGEKEIESKKTSNNSRKKKSVRPQSTDAVSEGIVVQEGSNTNNSEDLEEDNTAYNQIFAASNTTNQLPNIFETNQLYNSEVTRASVINHITCLNLEAAFGSDPGMERDNNEDSLTAFLGIVPKTEVSQELVFGFFAVADGMGGHEHGEIASNLAIRIALKGVVSEIFLRTIDGHNPGYTGEIPGEVLTRIISNCNQIILQAGGEGQATMGTTLTSAVLIGNIVYIGHVGDSRLYGYDKNTNQLKQLTRDHSVVARLVEAGMITAEEAAISPQRSILYKSLGQRLNTVVDTDFVRVSDFSYLLLCSDGLWEMLQDSQIGQIIANYKEPYKICEELIKGANDAGGDDNISVIVVKL